MTVAIISYPQDAHAQHVLNALQIRRIPAQLLNLGEYPEGLESAILIEQGVDLSFSGIEGMSGVWWRRPLGGYRDEPSLMEKYVASEAESYVRALQYFYPQAVWVSDPDATRIAGRKPYQLLKANEIGMKVPDTCMGNSFAAIQSFLSRHADVIVKPMNSSFVRLNPNAVDSEGMNRIIYAKRVQSSFLLEHSGRVSTCPFILQERIPKDRDIRVTVVGDQVFAAAIDGGEGDEIDWRHHSLKRQYTKHKLPSEVRAHCVKITKSLNLQFGCIDLGFSEKHGYSFFEINPQGQWLPSEEKLGYPITDALIGLLTT